jgi:hypothetical protein
MKILYRGVVYESNLHTAPTSHFNLDFINKIHSISTTVGKFIFKFIRSERYQLNTPVLVTNNPIIYVQISDDSAHANIDAEMNNYKNGYIITIPVKRVSTKDIGNDLFIDIIHEVTHVFQRENGESSELNGNHINGIDFNAYLNDSSEVNAFLMSIISFVTFSADRARLMSKLPFDVFVDRVLSYINASKKDFVEYMATGKPSKNKYDQGDNTHDSTRSKFYEILYLLHSKLKQGYFSPLSSMNEGIEK